MHDCVESKPFVIHLSQRDQVLLADVGRRLARGTGRFGEEGGAPSASLISIERIGEGRARIVIRDAVGVVATPTLSLHVRPKVDEQHALFLLRHGNLIPPTDEGRSGLGFGVDLANLVCAWFVRSVEHLIQQGLVLGYVEETSPLKAVRGRIDPLRTSWLIAKGQAAAQCTFEEFQLDTPLNRTIHRALVQVVRGHPLRPEVRERARRCLAYFHGVRDSLEADYQVALDRETRHYETPLRLGRQVLANTGRNLSAGEADAWTFLVRTPLAVQAGLHALIHSSLPELRVRPRSIQVPGLGTLNPDLVVGEYPLAVADIKYKADDPSWNRSDVYEVVAFAEGTGVERAAIIRFRTDDVGLLPPIQLGRIHVHDLVWRAGRGHEPEASAAEFITDFADWACNRCPAPQTIPGAMDPWASVRRDAGTKRA
jgi:hypothetical protein